MPSLITDRKGAVLFTAAEDCTIADLVRAAAADGLSLAGADLRAADFRGEDLSQVDFSDADLTGARFAGARLSHVNMTRALLDDADFSGSIMSDCFLSDARAQQASFASAAIEGGSFSEAGLYNADFADAFVSGVSFIKAQLARAHMERATFEDCDFHSASLGNVAFEKVKLNLCDFSSCHMRGASFTRGHVTHVKLDKSDLRYTKFYRTALVKCSLSRAVLTSADIRFGRFDECGMTGLRMRSALLLGNTYKGKQSLPAEMAAEKASAKAVSILSSIGSKAVVAGTGLVAALNAPEDLTSFAQSHLVGQGAVGMVSMMGASFVMRRLGPVLYEQVVKRIEKCMARSARPLPSMAAKLPLAAARHAFDDFHFAFATGLSERRVVSLVEKASKSDGKPDSGFRPLHAFFGKETTILVARDKETMDEVQRLLADGKESVFVARLDEEGNPRRHGPALYEFRRDGGMRAVWYHNGKPDYALVFGPTGSILAEHAYSGRERLLESDDVIRTHILSRGNTTRRQAVSWLMKPQGDSGRVMAEQGGIALVLRESAFYLRNASKLFTKEEGEYVRAAIGCASALDRIGSSRGDNLSPHFYANNISRTRNVMRTTSEALRHAGLYGFAARGEDLSRKLTRLSRIFRQEAVRREEKARKPDLVNKRVFVRAARTLADEER